MSGKGLQTPIASVTEQSAVLRQPLPQQPGGLAADPVSHRVHKCQLSLHQVLAAVGGPRLAALRLQGKGQVVPLLAHGGGMLRAAGGAE